MHYGYDAFCWYSGQVQDDAKQSTPIPPPDGAWGLRVVGQDWPRWNRYMWTVEPYVDVRVGIWIAIKAERDRRKDGGTLIGGKWFHSDRDSRIQQLGLVMMGSAIPAGLQWKTMDGTFVTMTQALAVQILAACAANEQAIFAHAESLRQQIEAAEDPASVDITSGWPPTFGQ